MEIRRHQQTAKALLNLGFSHAPIAQLDRVRGFETSLLYVPYSQDGGIAIAFNTKIPLSYHLKGTRAMRDLPHQIPDEIAFIIREKFGDMKALANSLSEFGVEYTSVYSVLVKSSHRPLRLIVDLAKPLKISPDTLAHILLIDDVDARMAELSDHLNGRSLNQWAREAGVSSSGISSLVRNLNPIQLRNHILILEALGLDLKRFLKEYEYARKAS